LATLAKNSANKPRTETTTPNSINTPALAATLAVCPGSPLKQTLQADAADAILKNMNVDKIFMTLQQF